MSLCHVNQANELPAYQQYRAPKQNGTALVQLTGCAQEDLRWYPQTSGSQPTELNFAGLSLAELRTAARSQVLQLARAYTQKTLQLDSLPAHDPQQQPILLSGHQPELFHSGVWFKNFLLSHQAQRFGGIAINFLVDNDLCRNPAIRVPARTGTDEFAVHSAAFDLISDALPWEMRPVLDRRLLESFPKRVQEILPSELPDPLINRLWPHVLTMADQGANLGAALAAGRHHYERSQGLETLEVPLSQICQGNAFAIFCTHLICQLPRFQQTYNDALTHYRTAHGIRNHAQPVPALQQSDHWLEAPLWVYRDDQPQRRALWVRLQGDHIVLSDRDGWSTQLEESVGGQQLAAAWQELASAGVHLRPRALLTTMFMRLMVGDVFLHGIGGAKYDQLTDKIIMDFFGLRPPPVCVATATLELPLQGRVKGVDEKLATARRKLWELRHNPDRACNCPEMLQLVEQKQRLLSDVPERGHKWQWHLDLTAVKQQMLVLASGQIEALQKQIDQLTVQQRKQRIAASREYSFCLFPESDVTTRLAELASDGLLRKSR